MLLEEGPLMEIKKFGALLSVLILASLIPVSSAGGGGRRMLTGKPVASSIQEFSKKALAEEDVVLHHRILNDYENYEPTPSLSKPPFKLIPN